MGVDLHSWALPQLRRLLPIDEQSLKQVINYSVSLSKDAGAEHLKNLLGDSAPALEFISSFNSRRPDKVNLKAAQLSGRTAESSRSETTDDKGPSPKKRGNKKARATIHNAGAIRHPENYGDVAGGYTKSSMEEDYMPRTQRPSNALSSALSLSQQPAALLLPDQTHQIAPSPNHLREPTPASQPKLPPSASGSLISDLPNVKSKTSKKLAHGSLTPQQAITTSSINDITSAIAALELSTNPLLSSERRKCQCNASIHPLFETAPNCLSCGKIICALEGLQPCSFCGNPIIPKEQVQTMIRALKDERGQEKMAAHNAAVSHSGRGTPMLGSGAATPESSGDEGSTAAAKARAHRDRLLAFQSENAQRTKVHDEAADLDMTATPGATQWMSPVQRAAALKNQQRYLRELEQANRPEWEKRKTVMSMSIRNGKLVRTYETVERSASQEADDAGIVVDQAEEEDSNRSRGLSQNPLLSGGGLIRPIWKALDDQKEERESLHDDKQRGEEFRMIMMIMSNGY